MSKIPQTLRTWLFVLPWGLEHVGGVNQVVANLIRQVQQAGSVRAEILVADHAFRKPTPILGAAPTTVRFRLPDPGGLGASLKASLSVLVSLSAAVILLPWYLRRRHVWAVNIHYLTPACYVFSLLRHLRLLRPKLIVSLHGTDVESIRGSTVSGAACRQVLKSADAVVTPSHSLRRRLLDVLPQLTDRTHVIHNGIDPSVITKAVEGTASATGARHGVQTIVTLGTFSRVKAHDILIRAFEKLSSRCDNVQLVIAGKDGPELQATRDLVETLGLTAKVTIVVDAPHEQALRLVKDASVFVLPSRQESFGIAVLEAGFLGVPVVASRVGGIPEIIVDGESGSLVEPENVNDLANAILEVLTRPAFGGKLAESLQERVNSEFLWSKSYARYEALLRN